MKPVFMTALWQKLIMANYEIDPAVLAPVSGSEPSFLCKAQFARYAGERAAGRGVCE